MIWLYLLLALLGVIIVLIFTSFWFVLDTQQNRLYIAYGKILKASAFVGEADISLTVNFFGFKKSISLLEKLAGMEGKKPFQEIISDTFFNRKKRAVPMHLIFGVLKSFRVKTFYLNVDLGSVYYNAWLFPLGEIFAKENVYCTTNFSGKAEAEIIIKNNPARVFWALTKAHFKQKTK